MELINLYIQYQERSNLNINQGFFGPRIPVDNMQAQVVGTDYLIKNLGTEFTENLTVVSPDAGGVHRAKRFQEHLQGNNIKSNLAMIIKMRAGANQIDRMDLVGKVEGKTCIIIDDMIDTAVSKVLMQTKTAYQGTLCRAADELKKNGATKVIAFATHGLFSGPAIKRINESSLDKVMVTNSIPLSEEKLKSEKIVQLDISLMLAETIRRIHQKESLSQLFASHIYTNQQ